MIMILYYQMFSKKEWFGDSEPPPLLGKSTKSDILLKRIESTFKYLNNHLRQNFAMLDQVSSCIKHLSFISSYIFAINFQHV